MYQGVGYGQVAVPFVIGWHDIPGRGISTALGEGILVGFYVVGPVFALGPIAGRELPGLVFILFSCQQAAFLLIFTDVEEELEQDRPAVCQQRLKMINFLVTLAPYIFGNQIMDASYQHIFILRTVENTHDALRGCHFMYT